MKQQSSFSRYNLFWVMLLCYLLPVLGICIYGALVPHEVGGWKVFSLGFLFTAGGTLLLFWLMTKWEKALSFTLLGENSGKEPARLIDPVEYDLTKHSLEEARRAQVSLLSEIDALLDEKQKLTLHKEETLRQSEQIESDLEQTKREARQQLESQQTHIRELQEALADQKTRSEKKHQQMLHLESKVGDLTHELKTLLQRAEAHTGSLLSNEPMEPGLLKDSVLAETHPEQSEEPEMLENSIETIQEASRQLNHCLDIAQKIKGSQRFGSQIYTFMDSPADSFSLDLRRLCDRLRSETESIILLYSPKDNHLLFASNQIKSLTGWSQEKFVQNFSDMLIDELEWKEGVGSLAIRSEAQIKVGFKTKSGPGVSVNANLGMIPTGIFRNHVIAILYSSAGLLESKF